MTVIDAQDINKTYSSSSGSPVIALEDTTFAVEDGEFVTVVGPSGCGKTTLMNICAGLDHPTSGVVDVSGQPVTGPRDDTSVVFQKPVLLPWMTVTENTLLPIRSRRKIEHADHERAKALLGTVGLADFASHYPSQLSGGMAQRNGLARGLMTDPKVLFLDEPFAALDALTREDLMVHLASLWEHQDKAAVFITHNIEEAVFLGDRVVVMSPRPGRIVHEEIVPIERPRTRSLMGDSSFIKLVQRVRGSLESISSGDE